MNLLPGVPDYGYRSPEPSSAHSVLWPKLRGLLLRSCPPPGRVLDFGCGNGAITGRLAGLGYDVCGVDISESGIAQARKANPGISFSVASVYDELEPELGTFDIVVSLEVIEHLYAPRLFMRTFRSLLRTGGTGVLSTPYHGYWKNLAIAMTGHFEAHFSPLWDGGHIKFWSIGSLRALLDEYGFHEPRILRVGRIPPLATSMVAVFSRSAA